MPLLSCPEIHTEAVEIQKSKKNGKDLEGDVILKKKKNCLHQNIYI